MKSMPMIPSSFVSATHTSCITFLPAKQISKRPAAQEREEAAICKKHIRFNFLEGGASQFWGSAQYSWTHNRDNGASVY